MFFVPLVFINYILEQLTKKYRNLQPVIKINKPKQ